VEQVDGGEACKKADDDGKADKPPVMLSAQTVEYAEHAQNILPTDRQD
jgi:hypothetical protein